MTTSNSKPAQTKNFLLDKLSIKDDSLRETAADVAMVAGSVGATVVAIHQIVAIASAASGPAVLFHIALGLFLPMLCLFLAALIASALDGDAVDRWKPGKGGLGFKPAAN